uniref:Uncharacterized protein MANES_01G220800 n=1 Tax=Rhizophora mucronata TaxID=61149 RepID=A0A2P2IXM7_RHIMU
MENSISSPLRPTSTIVNQRNRTLTWTPFKFLSLPLDMIPVMVGLYSSS